MREDRSPTHRNGRSISRSGKPGSPGCRWRWKHGSTWAFRRRDRASPRPRDERYAKTSWRRVGSRRRPAEARPSSSRCLRTKPYAPQIPAAPDASLNARAVEASLNGTMQRETVAHVPSKNMAWRLCGSRRFLRLGKRDPGRPCECCAQRRRKALQPSGTFGAGSTNGRGGQLAVGRDPGTQR